MPPSPSKTAPKDKDQPPADPPTEPTPPQPSASDIATSEPLVEDAKAALTEETQARSAGPLAAPLEPAVTDLAIQRTPLLGHPDSSTNNVAAAAAVLTQPGATHHSFSDGQGNTLPAEDLFLDEGPERTVVTAKHRIHEVYTFPNATATGEQLLYPVGVEVPRAEADRVIAAAKAFEQAQQQG